MNIPMPKEIIQTGWALLVGALSLALLLTVAVGCGVAPETEQAPVPAVGDALPAIATDSFGYTPEGFLFAGAVDAPVTCLRSFQCQLPRLRPPSH